MIGSEIMDAKYQKYYDKLKGINLSPKAKEVVNGCNSLSTNTSKLNLNVSLSLWEELGLKQIKSAVIPAFQQAVDAYKSNCEILQKACDETSSLVSLLEQLDSACKKYDSCPDDEEHASEKRSLKDKIREYESQVDSKISSIKGLNSSIQDIVVDVSSQGQEYDESEFNTGLEGLNSDVQGEFVYYNMGDYHQDYGGGKKISQAGCGPTSLAMVLSTYTGQNITPVDTAQYAMQHKYRIIGNGTSDELFPAMCQEYGIEGEFQTPSSQNIINALQQGKLVIAHMGKGTFTNGGHYIVLRGLTEDGKVLVGDPSHPQYSNKAFSADLISRESKARMYVV